MGLRTWRGVVLVAFVSLVMAGCLGRGVSGERDLRKNLEGAVATESRSADQILGALQEKFETAYADELNVYAPTRIIAAEGALAKGRAYHAGGHEAKAITEGLFAETMLVEAYALKNNAMRVLARVFASKARLDAMGAGRIFPDRYGAEVKGLQGAVQRIEKGDMKRALKDEARLLASMRVLEVDVVTFTCLHKAEETLELARRAEARKMAPKSWLRAEEAMDRARRFIEKSPGDEAGASAKGAEATRAARHALAVAREGAAIRELAEKELWEEIVLGFEGHLTRVGLALGADDLTGEALRDRVAGLAAVAGELKRAAGDGEKAKDIEVVPSEAQQPAIASAPLSGEQPVAAVEPKEAVPEARDLVGEAAAPEERGAGGMPLEPVDPSVGAESGGGPGHEAMAEQGGADAKSQGEEPINQDALAPEVEPEAFGAMMLPEPEAPPQAPEPAFQARAAEKAGSEAEEAGEISDSK